MANLQVCTVQNPVVTTPSAVDPLVCTAAYAGASGEIRERAEGLEGLEIIIAVLYRPLIHLRHLRHTLSIIE